MKKNYVIEQNASQKIANYLPPQCRKVVLFYDLKLKKYAKEIEKNLKSHSIHCLLVALSAGESIKAMKQMEIFADICMKGGVDRKSLFIALGGGTVGDAVGFFASIYMRGVEWIGIPSTLVAQVDSSLGGKTAINHKLGKNILGTFHQPYKIICDVALLKTLGQKELVSGLGEILKYGITFDPAFFRWAGKNLNKIMQGHEKSLEFAIKKSLDWKFKTIKRDVFDTKGVREVLNFGHTFGHALETYTNYHYFQHGEAVIWGIKFALLLSWIKEMLSERELELIMSVLDKIPVTPIPDSKKVSILKLMDLMKKDKKSINGEFQFLLLSKIGKVKIRQKSTPPEIQMAWDHLLRRRR
ncbi:MAG: 3-dehydroquinate synthase [Bacteriovoracaceae bacterium]|nr:3-dehydroquinate synthase [Bacteriovoracaceae bacterium]